MEQSSQNLRRPNVAPEDDGTPSAEQALAKFNKDHYEIIVTDFAARGDEPRQNTGSAAPSKPVVLLTAFPPVHLPRDTDLVLIKPLDGESPQDGIAAAE